MPPSVPNIPWVESPFFDDSEELAALDPPLAAKARFYRDNGYLVIDPGLDGALLDQAVADLDGRYEAGSGTAYANEHRIQDGWVVSDAVREIACSRTVRDWLYLLYRREPIPFQTLNFPRGTQQATHSDTVHFHCYPQRYMCGVWVALEDIDLDNGPLHYYPGSHKLPCYDMYDLGMAGSADDPEGANYRVYVEFIRELMRAQGLERHELQVKKGQALIWAANLAHGGSPIVDASRSRHSQVTHYYFTESVYTTPMHSDPVLGRALWREITNVRNGVSPAQYYNGQRVGPDRHWPPVVPDLAADPRRAEPRPIELATPASIRVLAWPRYDEPRSVADLFAEFAPLLRELGSNGCLCLRFDRNVDPPFDEVSEQLGRAANAAGGLGSVLILDGELPMARWPDLGASVHCAIAGRAPGFPTVQEDFLRALGTPVLRDAASLRARLLASAA